VYFFIFYTFFHKNLLVNLHFSTNIQYGQHKNVAAGVDEEENKLSRTKLYKTLPMHNTQPGDIEECGDWSFSRVVNLYVPGERALGSYCIQCYIFELCSHTFQTR